MTQPTHATLAAKLLHHSEVVTETGCRLWLLGLHHGGYGVVRHQGHQYVTHIASYQTFVGDVPPGKLVLHRCDVRCCIKPEHLYVGTHADNGKDKADRNRAKGSLSGAAVLDEKKVAQIKEALRQGVSKSVIAKTYGVSRSNIVHIAANRTWTHVK